MTAPARPQMAEPLSGQSLGSDDARAIAAERVPDMEKLPRRGVENRDLPLIWRGIADVATGHRDDVPAVVAERRGDLFFLRERRDGGAPDRVAVGDGELLDVAIR